MSDGHPFDPPANVALSSCESTQPDFADATLRALSYVQSDYSGNNSPNPYIAETHFSLSESLFVEVVGLQGLSIHMVLAVPMHGFMAGRGNEVGDGFAYSELNKEARLVQNLVGSVNGSLALQSTSFEGFTAQAVEVWEHDVTNSEVTIPTPLTVKNGTNDLPSVRRPREFVH